jgi:hypothetical protein
VFVIRVTFSKSMFHEHGVLTPSHNTFVDSEVDEIYLGSARDLCLGNFDANDDSAICVLCTVYYFCHRGR